MRRIGLVGMSLQPQEIVVEGLRIWDRRGSSVQPDIQHCFCFLFKEIFFSPLCTKTLTDGRYLSSCPSSSCWASKNSLYWFSSRREPNSLSASSGMASLQIQPGASLVLADMHKIYHLLQLICWWYSVLKWVLRWLQLLDQRLAHRCRWPI